MRELLPYRKSSVEIKADAIENLRTQFLCRIVGAANHYRRLVLH